MKTEITEKVIIIKTTGPILPKGGVYGPTIAYREKISEIAVLLRNHYPIYEQLADGTEVRLTLLNYKDDLNGDEGEDASNFATPVVTPEPIKETVVKTAGKVEAPKPTVAPAVTAPAVNNKDQKNNTQSTSSSKADDLTSK